MIAFIGCVKQKRDISCKAIDLYTSDLFCKSIAFARAKGVEKIYILSAKYGIIPEDAQISPYDETLNAKSEKERKAWAYRVVKQADALGINRTDKVLFLCGENYCKYLRMIYKNRIEPLRGLGLGKRLSYLKKHISIA